MVRGIFLDDIQLFGVSLLLLPLSIMALNEVDNIKAEKERNKKKKS